MNGLFAAFPPPTLGAGFAPFCADEWVFSNQTDGLPINQQIQYRAMGYNVSSELHFEQPLSERMRTFLRIEHLMAKMAAHLDGKDIWSSHNAVMTLLELYALLTRGDIKREVINEIERQTISISKHMDSPGVDKLQLDKITGAIRQHADTIHSIQGPVGQHLKHNEFLNSIRQRSSIPGGLCDFDLPSYHYWLNQPVAYKLNEISSWLTPFTTLNSAIKDLLSLVRQSTDILKVTAENGFYQQSLDLDIAYQLIRVSIPANAAYYPEISAGKHRFSIRFLQQSSANERPSQLSHNLEFKLTCCAI